jgi:hypothetical protein
MVRTVAFLVVLAPSHADYSTGYELECLGCRVRYLVQCCLVFATGKTLLQGSN